MEYEKFNRLLYEFLNWENWEKMSSTIFERYIIANFIEKIGRFFIYFISAEFYFLVESKLNIDPAFSKKEIKNLGIII